MIDTIFRRIASVFIVIVFLYTCVLLGFSLATQNSMYRTNSELNSIELIGEYSYDNENFHPLENYEFSENPEALYFKGHVSKNITEGETVMLRIRNIMVKVKVNGNLVYSFGEEGTYPFFSRSAGNIWGSFESTGITTEDIIEVELLNFYLSARPSPFDTLFSSIYAGDQYDLLIYQIGENVFSFFSSISVFFLGILVLGFSFISVLLNYGRGKESFWLAGLLIFSGIWMFENYDYLSLLVPFPVFNSIGFMITLSFTILFAVGYVSSTSHYPMKYSLWINFYLIALMICTQIFCQLIGILDISLWLTADGIVAIISAIHVMGTTTYEVLKLNNSVARFRLLVLLPVVFGAIIDLLLYLFGQTTKLQFISAGLLIFAIVQVVYMSLAVRGELEKIKNANVVKDELTKNQTRLMLSQIKPHFLYNSLNAIGTLCLTDPDKADEAIVTFSNYLRSNLNMLENDTLIPFKRELDHIKNYVAIEKMRFGDNIEVLFDVSYDNFLIPTLSIQPIIENAIKHGLNKKGSKGTIILSVSKNKKDVEIVVSDDGIGFDTKLLNEKTESVGLKNIKQRLKLLSNASFVIKSEIGIGTKVTVVIPNAEVLK